jgi:hypothetical protein
MIEKEGFVFVSVLTVFALLYIAQLIILGKAISSSKKESIDKIL